MHSCEWLCACIMCLQVLHDMALEGCFCLIFSRLNRPVALANVLIPLLGFGDVVSQVQN